MPPASTTHDSTSLTHRIPTYPTPYSARTNTPRRSPRLHPHQSAALPQLPSASRSAVGTRSKRRPDFLGMSADVHAACDMLAAVLPAPLRRQASWVSQLQAHIRLLPVSAVPVLLIMPFIFLFRELFQHITPPILSYHINPHSHILLNISII